MTTKAKTAKELATALGFTKGRISQLRKCAWFPKPGDDGWDVEEVRRLIEFHRRGTGPQPAKRRARVRAHRKPSAPKLSPALEIAPVAQADIEADGAIGAAIRVLEDPAASAIEQAKAARQVCANLFARAARDPRDGLGRIADDLKKSLEEQRRAEKAWLDLERQKGQLIQRSAAIRVATELARQAATTMDSIEAQIASQVEVWIGDREFMNGDALARQRRVISFFDRCARRVREANADTVETMIAQSQGDIAPDLDDEEEES